MHRQGNFAASVRKTGAHTPVRALRTDSAKGTPSFNMDAARRKIAHQVMMIARQEEIARQKEDKIARLAEEIARQKNAHAKEMEQARGRIVTLEAELKQARGRIAALEAEVEQARGRITTLESMMEEQRSMMEELRTTVLKLEQKDHDREQKLVLREFASSLESKLMLHVWPACR